MRQDKLLKVTNGCSSEKTKSNGCCQIWMDIALQLLKMCLIQTTLIISEWMRSSVRLLSNDNSRIRMNDIRIEADAVERLDAVEYGQMLFECSVCEWITTDWDECGKMRSNADGRGWIQLNYVLLKYNSSEGNSCDFDNVEWIYCCCCCINRMS